MEKREIEFNWGPGIFIITYHILLLIALPFYFYYASIQLSTVIASIIFLYITGISITAGYHRFYAHRAYKVHPFLEGILLFFGSAAGQGSALRWGFDHRLHHAHVDTDNDPYSIKKGFWYAHILWIFEKPRTIQEKIVPDLMKNRMVMLQHRYYPLWMVLTNFVIYAFTGWLLNDYLGAFFLVVWARFFALHHFTWFINSLAHTWGDKPFSEEHSAVDNYILSMLTFGEGYHNYHHTFANDYRNGIKWYHFDPTKWVIWTLSLFGLAHGLKRTDSYTIQKRMVLEKKSLLIEQVKKLWDEKAILWEEKKAELEKEVLEISERIVARISAFNQLKEKYFQSKLEHTDKKILKALKRELKFLKKSLRNDWRYWSTLSRHIMRLAPQT